MIVLALLVKLIEYNDILKSICEYYLLSMIFASLIGMQMRVENVYLHLKHMIKILVS